MDLEAIDTKPKLIDAWSRVENGIITESLIEETVNGVRLKRPIREVDIERRGHPLDWYVRVTKVERANIPRYYRRSMNFKLVRNSDATASVWVKEEAKLPTIAYFLYKLREEGVTKFSNMSAYAKGLFLKLVTSSIEMSLLRFAKSRGYDSLESAFGYIGSHVEKYDNEGRRLRYLASESWVKYEWYTKALASDLLPFPVKADDILNHLPRLSWEETVPVSTNTTDETNVAVEATTEPATDGVPVPEDEVSTDTSVATDESVPVSVTTGA